MVRKMVLVGVMMCVLAVQMAAAEEPLTVGRETSSASHESHYWGDAGYGVMAVFSNVFYMPAKFVYASIGALTGGLAYVLTVGDSDAAQKVWSPSVGGSYVITPGMLRGDEPILFNGTSYRNE